MTEDFRVHACYMQRWKYKIKIMMKREKCISLSANQILYEESPLLFKLVREIPVNKIIKFFLYFLYCSTPLNTGSIFLMMFYLQSLTNMLQIFCLYMCEGNSSDDIFVSLSRIQHSVRDNMVFCDILFWQKKMYIYDSYKALRP